MIIVALGVSFFSGLGATSADMKITGDDYFDEKQLMDIHVISSYGITDDDLASIAAVSEVQSVFPGYNMDSLAENNGSSYVLKLHSLTDANRPELLSGRMPEKAGEILIESEFLGKQIGDSFKLKSGKDVDIRQNLRTDTFRVVGIIRSPYYISKERGSGSIGSGSVDYYAYLHPVNFLQSVYSEAFVKLKGVDSLLCFSDAYKDIVDDIADKIELVGDTREIERYHELTNAAYDNLEAARAKLAAREAEFRETILKSEAELQASIAELDQSEYDMPVNQALIDEGLRQLDVQEAQILSALRDIDTAELQPGLPAETLETLMSQRQSLRNSLLMIDESRNELEQSRYSMLAGNLELLQNRRLLEVSLAELEITRAGTEVELILAQEEIEAAQKELNDLETPEWFVLDRDSNPGYASYDQDTDKIGAIARVFPLLFFLVAALVSLTTMTRLVEERRVEIGALKSLGYGNISIVSKYVVYAASPTLFGGFLGGYFGMKFYPALIMDAYSMLYALPPAQTPVNYTYWIVGTGIAFFCTVFAAVFSCMRELGETPASLMRPKPPKAGKRTFFERLTFFWKRLSFTYKVTIRNITRYKKRFYMTVIGIAGCTALLVTAFGLLDSISAVMTLQYGEICLYDMSVTFSNTAKKQDITKVGDMLQNARAEGYLKLYEKTMDAVDIENLYTTRQVTLIVPENIESLKQYIVFRDRVTHDQVHPSADGVIITEKISQLLGLSPGDSIVIKEEDKNPITATVSGIVENYFFHYVYMPPELYETLYREELEYNAIYALLNDTDSRLANEILDKAGVSSLTFTKNTKNTFDDTMDNMNFVVFVLIVSAGALAFVVLLNLSSINISERMRELATIEVLGFFDSEVSNYIFRESAILTLIGALAGLGLGVGLHLYVILTAETDIVMFGRTIKSASFIYSLALTVFFSVFTNLFASRKLKEIQMVEALKSVE
ncbi:MAG: ABC transporter permease [Clostridiales bacterium]|jgi:putative ABC transport system permease protein|nr:ABC transporter permease [Clostridiales bacterium]